MSDFFDDPEILQAFKKSETEIKAKFIKKIKEKEILAPKELNDVIDANGKIIKKGLKRKSLEFFKEQLKLPKSERQIFYPDDYGYQYFFFKVDDAFITDKSGKVWNIVKDKNNEWKFSVTSPLLGGDERMDIKIPQKLLLVDGKVKIPHGVRTLARGNGYFQYQPSEKLPMKKNEEGYWIFSPGDPEAIEKKWSFFDMELVKVMSYSDNVEYERFSDIPKSHYVAYPKFKVLQVLEAKK